MEAAKFCFPPDFHIHVHTLSLTLRVLATRIADLEHRLRAMEISELWTSEDTNLSELLWSDGRWG